jgi:hypothetical protein
MQKCFSIFKDLSEKDINEETVEVPIIGKIVADKKFGNRVIYNKSMGNNKVLKIQSFTTEGVFYDVDIINKTCTCPAFMKKNTICKHLSKVLGLNKSGFSNSLLNQMFSFRSSKRLIDIVNPVKIQNTP